MERGVGNVLECKGRCGKVFWVVEKCGKNMGVFENVGRSTRLCLVIEIDQFSQKKAKACKSADLNMEAKWSQYGSKMWPNVFAKC